MMSPDFRILESNEVVPAPFADVFSYWLKNRGTAFAPPLSNFKLYELPPLILPWSIIVDVGPDGSDFRYRFWGTKRTQLIDAEMTGKWVSDISNSFMREANFREYKQALNVKKPILCNTPIVTGAGRHAVFQSVRMPLSDDGETVSQIFSATNFEEMSPIHYEFFGTDPRK